MARQSRSRPAPRAAPRAAPAQSRSSSTAAAPAPGHSQSHAPPAAPPVPAGAAAQTSQGPGLMGQIAANAASVAVGSTIGHGLSSMLFGGRSEPAPAPEAVAQAAPVAQTSQGISCDSHAQQFTQCLEKADLPSCTWYLEQLKACQAAAAPY
ncbi:hypothetical protein DFH11DRAFT_1544690 [Phellopilus nigrolimitatus]|nr:hypothetical protein DFH11DRAFT_1544690 [Phellopilus nigrolimitatus]